MSVKVCDRKESRLEYINLARQINEYIFERNIIVINRLEKKWPRCKEYALQVLNLYLSKIINLSLEAYNFLEQESKILFFGSHINQENLNNKLKLIKNTKNNYSQICSMLYLLINYFKKEIIINEKKTDTKFEKILTFDSIHKLIGLINLEFQKLNNYSNKLQKLFNNKK